MYYIWACSFAFQLVKKFTKMMSDIGYVESSSQLPRFPFGKIHEIKMSTNSPVYDNLHFAEVSKCSAFKEYIK